MTFDRLLIVALLAVSLPPAAADSPAAEDCSGLEDDNERLACYDAVFGRNVDGEASDGRSAPSVATPTASDAEPAPAAAAAAEFGAEQVEQRIEHLEARLVGDFTGWDGNTRFRLDNGQVWQQTKNYIPDYEPREPIPEPRVTISRGWMGSYNLRVEGVKRIVQVKRIK